MKSFGECRTRDRNDTSVNKHGSWLFRAQPLSRVLISSLILISPSRVLCFILSLLSPFLLPPSHFSLNPYKRDCLDSWVLCRWFVVDVLVPTHNLVHSYGVSSRARFCILLCCYCKG